MVKVREEQPVRQDGSVDLELWLERLQTQIEIKDAARFLNACQIVQAAVDETDEEFDDWSTEQGALMIGLEMVQILADLQQDEDALIAAVLYRAVRERKLPLERVKSRFGNTVAHLIEGVLQMAAIASRKNPRDEDPVLGNATQTDNVRKMLVAMIDDVRVALIKLAERTCAIRAVKSADRRKRYLVAREVFDIYAPLAHRLGIGHIKWELEDLSFRYLKPNDYKHIAGLLSEKRLDRQHFIDDVVTLLRARLLDASIDGEVAGRAKHIYSIWRKCSARISTSARFTTCVPSEFWDPRYATVTPCLVLSTGFGAIFRTSSMTTSHHLNPMATAHCIPLYLVRRVRR